MGFYLELVGLAVFSFGLFVTDLHEKDFAELAKGGWRAQPATAPKGLVAVANGLDQVFTVDRSDVLPRVLAETPFFRLAVLFWQIGNLVGFPLQYPVFLAEIEKAATEFSRNHANVLSSELGPSAISRCLLYGLFKFRFGYGILFTLDDGKRPFPLGILENNQVGTVTRYAVGNSQFDADVLRLVVVAVDQFRPIFSADFLLRVGIAFGVGDKSS